MSEKKKAPTRIFTLRSMKTPLAALAAATLISACSPRVDNHGNAVHIDDISAIEPGVHTRDHVLNKLGSPSSRSTFGDTAWYYISERTETTAFFAPDLIDRQVIVVKFDEHGVVQSVDVYDKESAQLVEPVDRETPTAGNTLGFIEQIISNIGRFNR